MCPRWGIVARLNGYAAKTAGCEFLFTLSALLVESAPGQINPSLESLSNLGVVIAYCDCSPDNRNRVQYYQTKTQRENANYKIKD